MTAGRSILHLASGRRWALTALFVVAVSHAAAWALVIPPWQGPDENIRYTKLQDAARKYGVQLVDASVVVGSVDATTGKVESPPPDVERDLALRPIVGAMPRLVSGYAPKRSALDAELFAPVYALLAPLLGTWMPYVVRFLGCLFAGVVALGTWRLAAVLWPTRFELALAAGSIPALLPMAAATHATALPDAMADALAAWALALLVAIVVVGGSVRRWAAAAALVVAAALTKQTALYLVPLALGFVPIAAAAAHPERVIRRPVAWGLTLWLLGAVTSSSVIVGGQRLYGSYPLTRLADPLTWVRGFAPLLNVVDPPLVMRSLWSGVGWLQVFFPRPLEHVLVVLSLLVVAGSLVVLALPSLRARAALDRSRLAALAILALAGFMVLSQTLMRETLSVAADVAGTASQARWLFSALPAFAVAAVLAIGSWLRPGADRYLLTAIVAAMAALSTYLSVGLTVPYFYVVFPEVLREHRLFFGRLIEVDRTVMLAAVGRPNLIASPVLVVLVFAVWGAAAAWLVAAAWTSGAAGTAGPALAGAAPALLPPTGPPLAGSSPARRPPTRRPP